jgi:ubiquitin-like protein ATG12
MKKKKWAVDANKTVAYLVEFIRKYIKCAASDSLVCRNATYIYKKSEFP